MIDAVVFDLGDVLARDVWEHMFLDPDRGLAVRFGLDAHRMRKAGHHR